MKTYEDYTEEVVEDEIIEDDEVIEEEVDNEVIEDETEEEVEETVDEKKFSQADYDKFINRTHKRYMRKMEAQEQKYDELLHTLKNGMQLEDEGLDIDSINSRMKQAFEDQGIDIPSRNTELSKADQEILANARADEVLSGDIEDVAEEYERLRDKDNLTYGEQIQFNKYQNKLAIYQAKEELEKEGKDSSVIESQKFINFASKYKADISLSEIYDDFTKYNKPSKPTPRPAGSVKGKSNKNKIKNHYSVEEAKAFSTEDLLKNPKLLDAINKSSEEW